MIVLTASVYTGRHFFTRGHKGKNIEVREQPTRLTRIALDNINRMLNNPSFVGSKIARSFYAALE